MSDTDNELLVAWRGGDRKAGGKLIDRHYRSLYRFFYNKARSRDEVEELVQRTFTSAVEGVARFRGDASLRTWLFAIARNILRQSFDEHRRRLRRSAPLETISVADLGPGPNTLIGKAREHRLLLEALRTIPFESQMILELRYWEHLTTREIAQVLECPSGTARSRLARAKDELRAGLDSLARTREELESTANGLEHWAEQIRLALR